MAKREVEEAALRYLVEDKGVPWILAREALVVAAMEKPDPDAYIMQLAKRGGYAPGDDE
ncbi:MAG: hypothetical protein OEM67_10685 [Thermoleophilia bacterium]|nr:hypothetical protein [Thermoleophilia bacterium]